MTNSNKTQYAKDQLSQFKTQIDPLLDQHISNLIAHDKQIYTQYSIDTLEAFRSVAARGGKRLRGAFVYYMYQMYCQDEKPNLDEAIKVSMIIEMIHAYILIVDDWMDKSLMRRGGPTAHKILEGYHDGKFPNSDKNNTEHFGAIYAIMASALGNHHALQFLSSLDFPVEILNRINKNLNQRIYTTYHGQVEDTINTYKDDLTEQDIITMLERKTGAYTYENPIHTGAILGGASDEELEKLSEYAIPAGVAFQIQDDILGMYGDESTLGKSTLDDLREGKMTLLTYKVLEIGTPEQKKILNTALGNPDLSKEQHKQVQDIMVETGALQYAKDLAQEYVQKAKDTLVKNHNPKWNSAGLDFLNGIADYMIDRDI